MPKGIYKRTKKTKRRINPNTKAATKRRGPGRPPGKTTKKRGRPAGKTAKKAAPATPRVRKSAGRARGGQVFADFGAMLVAINEFGKLLDQRSKIIVNSLNEIGDAIREAGGIETDKPTEAIPAPQANAVPADEQSGASAPVS